VGHQDDSGQTAIFVFPNHAVPSDTFRFAFEFDAHINDNEKIIPEANKVCLPVCHPLASRQTNTIHQGLQKNLQLRI
jgi:hypothetical protein